MPNRELLQRVRAVAQCPELAGGVETGVAVHRGEKQFAGGIDLGGGVLQQGFQADSADAHGVNAFEKGPLSRAQTRGVENDHVDLLLAPGEEAGSDPARGLEAGRVGQD